ncbi:MAG TPA: hypothetical protein VFQ93_14865 [Casimicrobiaceae bacterium]|nr:hypothetical protein [Casimicrobiaceae bacterium]
MKASNVFMLASITIALAACNSADQNRTTSNPPGVAKSVPSPNVPLGMSAPAAPPERGPIPANANAAAPGTNATVAFTDQNEQLMGKGQPSKDGAAESQEQAVKAQEAAAAAPNTAAADAAKEQATIGDHGLRTPGTGQDTAANSPRHGTLTPAEESTQMPKAGQVNNYSDPALETDSGRPSTGNGTNK